MSGIALADGLTDVPDGRARCRWHGGHADYLRYHDEEWGRPVAEDDHLFEKLCLEGFQAGLSWLTILRKREAFREVFEGFGIERVAAFGPGEVEAILRDPRIVRHRGKIESAVNNARRVRALREERGSFSAFVWSFEPPAEERPERVTSEWMRANTAMPASMRLSNALRKRGFTFVGPTTMHAFMQAMGLVNDHLEGCVCRQPCEAGRAAFIRPA